MPKSKITRDKKRSNRDKKSKKYKKSQRGGGSLEDALARIASLEEAVRIFPVNFTKQIGVSLKEKFTGPLEGRLVLIDTKIETLNEAVRSSEVDRGAMHAVQEVADSMIPLKRRLEGVEGKLKGNEEKGWPELTQQNFAGAVQALATQISDGFLGTELLLDEAEEDRGKIRTELETLREEVGQH